MSDPNDFIIENGVLTKYVGPGGDVVIPEGVKEIGGGYKTGAFYRCIDVVSVKIPNSVTEIGWLAFHGCSALKNVNLPKNLTIINFGVFHDCGSLVSLTIPEGVTKIRDEAFCGCKKLANVVLPESMTEIGERAFMDCAKLSAIRIPRSVESIGMCAFSGCKKLSDLEIVGDRVILNMDAFSTKLPEGLVPKLSGMVKYMDDTAVKQYALNPKTWAKLDPDTQAGIFLTRQAKKLISAYGKCITEDQLEPLGTAILQQLQPNASPAECSAVATFIVLFSAKAPTQLLKTMLAQLKVCKNSTKALSAVEKDVALQRVLS